MPPMRLILGVLVATLLLVLPGRACRGEVSRIQIDSRDRVLDGHAFGSAGPDEKITGRVWFELDPSNPANDRIVDLDLSPRNARGQVEAARQPISASHLSIPPGPLGSPASRILPDMSCL